MSSEPLVIHRLEINRFKKITTATITPDGTIVTLRGKNAAGKSSVLDAIEAALHGGDAIPDAPVNSAGGIGPGTRAEIKLDMGSFIVERSIGANRKHTLKITSTDPRQVSTQAFLDERLGARSFDTSTFLRLKPKEQAEALRRAMGIDTEDLDLAYKAAFEERTIVNREVARLDGAIAQAPYVPGADKPVDVGALVAALNDIRTIQAEHDRVRAAAQSAERIVEESSRRVESLRAALIEAETEHAAAGRAAVRAQGLVAALVDEDPAPIEEALCNAQSTNEDAAKNARRQDLLTEHAAKAKEADALTARLKELERAKEAMLASSTFPVPNLKLVDDSIYLNGQPVSQASQAERVRLQAALWLAENPDVRVMLLRDASLLDEDSLAIMAQMVGDAGGQLWMEVVGTEGDGILIEDGAVVEQEVGS